MHSRPLPVAVLGALALVLSACGAAVPTPAVTGDDHGAVDGATEVDEAALGLTWIDPDGAVHHLDLLDETRTVLGAIAPATSMHTDGRYLFADTSAGIAVIDSGAWTWDHVDHFHYYRAEPRIVGVVPGDGPARVTTTNSSTVGGIGVYFTGSGEAVLLDTEALSKGELVEHWRRDAGSGEGLVVPVGSFALVTEGADAAASLVAYDTAGEAAGGVAETCESPAGTITTRVGAVVGCADGAVLASVRDGGLVVERIPYPEDAAALAATGFDNREGRPTVAALAGDGGIWLLDTRQRAWTLVTAPAPLVHVTAVDDEAGHVLALAEDGRVLVLDDTGAVLAETGRLVADAASATLVADQHRAYLAAPAEKRLYEIDFADGARIARVFGTPTDPTHLAETGR